MDWVQYNDGAHLSGGVKDDQAWQAQLKILAMMPARQYDAPIRRFGRSFVQDLAVELTGVRQSHWNAESFIVFQTVTLQRARNVTNSCEIFRRIYRRLDAW